VDAGDANCLATLESIFPLFLLLQPAEADDEIGLEETKPPEKITRN
jgi:hypothetical protein